MKSFEKHVIVFESKKRGGGIFYSLQFDHLGVELLTSKSKYQKWLKIYFSKNLKIWTIINIWLKIKEA